VKLNDQLGKQRTMSFHDPLLDASGNVMKDAKGEPVHHPYAEAANQLQDQMAQDRKRQAEATHDLEKMTKDEAGARDDLKIARAAGGDDPSARERMAADEARMGADLLAKDPHKYAFEAAADGKWTPAPDTKGVVTMSATDTHRAEPHEPIQARSGPPVDVAQEAQPLSVGGRG